MSELVKRVAGDVIRKVGPSIDPDVAEMTVRIVLEAMREPTAEMWASEQPTWSLGRPMWDWWRSMIDEALR